MADAEHRLKRQMRPRLEYPQPGAEGPGSNAAGEPPAPVERLCPLLVPGD